MTVWTGGLEGSTGERKLQVDHQAQHSAVTMGRATVHLQLPAVPVSSLKKKNPKTSSFLFFQHLQEFRETTRSGL